MCSAQLVIDRVNAIGMAMQAVQGKFYVGSTSGPSWRWVGGLTFRGEEGVPEYMPGHKLTWKFMYVIGCFQDDLAAQVETMAIKAAKVYKYNNTNIADDARGLAIRPFAYSYVYACTSTEWI